MEGVELSPCPIVVVVTNKSIVDSSHHYIMKNELNHYGILGLDEHASASEIRRAYLELCWHLHPDKHPVACPAGTKNYTEAFQRVQHAYETLRDDREAYDSYLKKSHTPTESRSQHPKNGAGYQKYHGNNTHRKQN